MKKPFYKRWWFWLIVVVVVLAIAGAPAAEMRMMLGMCPLIHLWACPEAAFPPILMRRM